ncbi:MAG: hypothetical protein COT85_03305 [Chlamydiae bacterium CG10_big_fil_rev_8_21_14_0_10_42_34]|nr:MAG: hypothetical protein COT85_03305 [Chlamydiae bacterium CG10_big_fil_rev_8_21_14_0_10_42_34]
MDLYCKMGHELRSLFKDLFDPSHADQIHKKMGKILQIANQIGGSVKEDAQRLQNDIESYLEMPNDPKRLAIMKRHALRLEESSKEI